VLHVSCWRPPHELFCAPRGSYWTLKRQQDPRAHCLPPTVPDRSPSSLWRAWSWSSVRPAPTCRGPRPPCLQLQKQWASLCWKSHTDGSKSKRKCQSCGCNSAAAAANVLKVELTSQYFHSLLVHLLLTGWSQCEQGVCCCIRGNSVAREWNSSEASWDCRASPLLWLYCGLLVLWAFYEQRVENKALILQFIHLVTKGFHHCCQCYQWTEEKGLKFFL